jgi:tetratricopeptide (TPR) repeat protein
METGKVVSANSIDNLPLKSRNNPDSNSEIAEFGRALALAPDNLEKFYSLADTLLSSGRLDEARAAYRKILDHQQTNVKAMMALIRIERRLGDNWAACNHLRVATKINPDNLQTLTDLAAVLRDLDRPEEATAIYQQVLAKKEDHVQSHMGLGWIARTRGNDEAAFVHFNIAHEHLRKASEAEPNNPLILTQLATALRGMNRAEKATAIYQKILAANQRHVQSHVGLGWIARSGGDDEAALAHFKVAAELDPTDAQVQITLGKLYLHMDRFEDAEMVFRRLLMRAPNHPQVRASLGALARKRHDWSGALEEFRAAVGSEPKNVSFRIDLARTFCDLSRWKEAEQTYRSVLEDSPRHIESLMGLAAMEKKRGNLRTALALFEEASVAAPLDLRPKQEIRRLKAAQGTYDWRTEVEEVIAVTRAADVPVETQLEAARILVEYGLTEAARSVLSTLEASFPAARRLLLAVRQIDRMGLAQPVAASSACPDAVSQLEALQGFLEMPIPGSDTILIVLAGADHRLWVTFSVLHKILRKTGVSIIYCRDLQRVRYARGIIGLGHDFQSTVEGFETLIARYGATRVLTLGNCVGCLAALRFGLSLGAQGVLGISPNLRVREHLQRGSRDEPRPVGHMNVHSEYLEASSRPNVTLIFGEHCAVRADDAQSIADVPSVTLVGIPDASNTDSVRDLLVRGLLEPLLEDFVANGVVSPQMRAQISTSRDPKDSR